MMNKNNLVFMSPKLSSNGCLSLERSLDAQSHVLHLCFWKLQRKGYKKVMKQGVDWIQQRITSVLNWNRLKKKFENRLRQIEGYSEEYNFLANLSMTTFFSRFYTIIEIEEKKLRLIWSYCRFWGGSWQVLGKNNDKKIYI